MRGGGVLKEPAAVHPAKKRQTGDATARLSTEKIQARAREGICHKVELLTHASLGR